MSKAGISSEGISFSLFGFPVVIRWSHWLLPLFISWPALLLAANGLRDKALVPLMIPLAVLIHELGHAVAVRVFGGTARIELVVFGGLTYPSFDRDIGPWRRAAVSFSGPLAGAGVGALVWVVVRPDLDFSILDPASLFVIAALVWGLLNLVPLPTLDGGHVLDGVMSALFGWRGERYAAMVKAVVGVAAIAAAWRFWGAFAALWIIIVIGRAGFEEIQNGFDSAARKEAEDALDAYRQGRLEEALAHAMGGIAHARHRRTRSIATDMATKLSFDLGDWERVVELTSDEEIDPANGMVRALALTRLSRTAEAEAVLRSMPPGPSVAALLAEALVRQDLDGRARLSTPEEAMATAARAAELCASGEPDIGDRVAAIVLDHDLSPRATVEALVQLGRQEDAVPVLGRLGPADRWGIDLELAGRAGRQDALASLIAAEPEYDALARAQIRLHQFGFYESAVLLGERAVGDPDPARRRFAAYNTACSLARLDRVDEALAWLERSMEGGILRTTFSDPDLAAVRRHAGFSRLVARAGARTGE